MKQFFAVVFVIVATTLSAAEWQRIEDFDFATEEGYAWLVLEEGQASLVMYNYFDGRSRTGDLSISVAIGRDVLSRGRLAVHGWDDDDQGDRTSIKLTDRGISGISYDTNAVEFYGSARDLVFRFIQASDNVAFELTLASGDTHEVVFDLPNNTQSEITWIAGVGRRYTIEEQRRLREELKGD